jgi:glutamate synthase (NADPH) large chain
MPMSPTVREKEPILRQVFIGRGNDVIVQDALERKLYVIRKTASAASSRSSSSTAKSTTW